MASLGGNSGSRPAGQAPTGLVGSRVDPGEELPTVISEGVVKLGDLEVKVLQLSNGERVIEADSFHEILNAIFGDDQ